MYGDNSSKMPLGLAMGLSTSPDALYKFLKMTDSEQDKIIQRAKEASTFLELHNLVKQIEAK